MNSNDSRMAAGCQNCFYGWGTFPASVEACFALIIVFVVIFAILGIAYSFLAATMAIQRIWQRHYHILTKRELTKVGTGFHALGLYIHSHGYQLNVDHGWLLRGKLQGGIIDLRDSVGLKT